MLESKKAINFDMNTKHLIQYYPSKSYRNAYRDIHTYLVNSGFIHRQYSGYVSENMISMIHVILIVRRMSKYFSWLAYCVNEFDVTIVGDEYSLKDYIYREKFLN